MTMHDAGIKKHLPRAVLCLCLVQPLMDVLSYWLDVFKVGNTLTLALRMALLAAITAGGFFLSRRKGAYLALAGVLAVYAGLHCFFCLQRGYADPVGDITNLIRICQLPLTTFAFVTFFRREPGCRDAARRGFLWAMLAVLAVELLSVVTGTNPYTYPNKSVGILGWFYFANAQSAILSMIVPVSIAYCMEKCEKRRLLFLAVTVAGFGMLYAFATRLAFASLVGCALMFCAAAAILWKLREKKLLFPLLTFALCTLIAVAALPLSPMAENARRTDATGAQKAADIAALVAADRAAAEAAGLSGDALELASLQSAYEKYLPGPTGRFGLERTAKAYAYSARVEDLNDLRREKLTYCRMLLEDSPLSARIFGLELAEMTWDGIVYDVENDFHGICYLCGYAGLALLIAFLLCIFAGAARALITDFPAVFNEANVGWAAAFCCGIAHAYFTAGVLRRPNTTFFLGVVLAGLWICTDLKRSANHTLRRPL